MKKIFKVFALVLVLSLAMSSVVFAEDVVHDEEGEKAYFDFAPGFGGEAVFENKGESVKVTVQSDVFNENDGYYLVLALKNEDIDEDSILYIDQIPAQNDKISFNVYPSTMTSCNIVITGVKADGTSDGRVKVAILEGKYVLGDVTGEGDVDGNDATKILRYLVSLETLDGTAMLAADVTGEGDVDGNDATKILRFLVSLETL